MTTSTFNSIPAGLNLTALDLCCGCGMASYGLTQAGVDIAGAWDIWENALETYSLNVSQDDALENWSIESALPWGDEARGRADIVIMGPPCQDDSRANHRSADKGRGELKHPALDRALEAGARWIVMEMVSKKYVPWATEKGARQIIRLNDSELGGFTGRTRWFAVWGPADLEIAKLPKSERKGWGDAFPHHDLDGALLTTEAHSKAKRWKHARTPDQPAHAVAGQGVAHVLRYADGEEVRLGPQEAAMLSGLPSSWQFADDQWISDGVDGRMVRFGARNFREAQTMIGNGWPVSFGKAIGTAIAEAEENLPEPTEPEPTPEPEDDEPEVEAPRRTVLSYGLGVDSTAILLRWLADPATCPCDLADLIVITAHVGDEFASTLELAERHVLPLLREHGIRFVQVGRRGKTGLKVLDDSREPARLYHDDSFKVSDEYRSGGTIPQTAGDRKCSMRAKGEIIDAWLLAELGDQVFDHVIGFEANEQGRAKRDATFTRDQVGEKKARRMPARAPSYPLITWGWDRQACVDFIADQLGGVVWPKSACTFCPFSCGKAEVMARFEAEPEAAHLALELEALALALNPRAKLYKRHSAREKMAAAGLDAILAEHGRRLEAATWALYSVTRVFTPSGGAVRKLEVLQTGTCEAVSLALNDAAARDGLAVQLDDDGFRRAWASHRRTVTERVKSGKGTRKRERTLPCVESYLVAGLAGAEPKTNAAFDTYLGRQLEAEATEKAA